MNIERLIDREIANASVNNNIAHILYNISKLVSPEREDLEKVVAAIKDAFPGEDDDLYRSIYNVVIEMYDIDTYVEDCDGNYFFIKDVLTPNRKFYWLYTTDISRYGDEYKKLKDAKAALGENDSIARNKRKYVILKFDEEKSKKLCDEQDGGLLVGIYETIDEAQKDAENYVYSYIKYEPIYYYDIIDKRTGEIANLFEHMDVLSYFINSKTEAFAYMYYKDPSPTWIEMMNEFAKR